MSNAKRPFLYDQAQAKALYLAGHTPESIAEQLGLKSGKILTNWARKGGWAAERDFVLKNTTASRLQELLKQQEDSIKELRLIRDKAFAPIRDDTVSPVKFSEAATAYINSLEEERKIKIEALQISFIAEVAQILREEIQDRNLLFSISERLKGLFEKYQQKSLPQGKLSDEEN